MKNEWKELKIDKCSEWPDDLLTGDYEFEYFEGVFKRCWCESEVKRAARCSILMNIEQNRTQYRYRKPEPKVHSHKEIMKPNRYWRGLDDEEVVVWEKADLYREYDGKYWIHDEWRSKEHFSGRSFKDGIPPETV